jgi:4-oxalocrotonate tautomerase
MPIIHVEFFPGRTLEQKRELVGALTEAMVRIAKVEPQDVWVVIEEVAKENFAVGGVLCSDDAHDE